MKTIFTVVMIAVFAMATTYAAAQEDRSSDDCECPKYYEPVCASNGETYINWCEFECIQKMQVSLNVIHFGACEISYPDSEESFDSVYDDFV